METNTTTRLNRYPGAQPFQTSQEAIFFGREEDRAQLHRYVKLESLVVLYAKSGLGKSSLINAGLIPKIQSEGFYTPLSILPINAPNCLETISCKKWLLNYPTILRVNTLLKAKPSRTFSRNRGDYRAWKEKLVKTWFQKPMPRWNVLKFEKLSLVFWEIISHCSSKSFFELGCYRF